MQWDKKNIWQEEHAMIIKIYGKKNMQWDRKKYMARGTCNEIKKNIWQEEHAMR